MECRFCFGKPVAAAAAADAVAAAALEAAAAAASARVSRFDKTRQRTRSKYNACTLPPFRPPSLSSHFIHSPVFQRRRSACRAHARRCEIVCTHAGTHARSNAIRGNCIFVPTDERATSNATQRRRDDAGARLSCRSGCHSQSSHTKMYAYTSTQYIFGD